VGVERRMSVVSPLFDILIPTYNRSRCLEQNLHLLFEQLAEPTLAARARIIVADNASPDDTAEVIARARARSPVPLVSLRHETNIGLEANSVAVLRAATAPYVVFLGDDDFLPDGYLARVAELLAADGGVTCIIPGMTSVFPDGSTEVGRLMPYEERLFEPGYRTLELLTGYGHQLSGLVLRREGLLEAYTRVDSLRNPYLFIFFVAFNLLRGRSWFLPRFSVKVTVGNAKDWSYDGAGLLPEILKNCQLLFPDQPLRRLWLSNVLMTQQHWRMSIGSGARRVVKSFMFLLRSPDVEPLVKVCLPTIYAASYGFRAKSRVKEAARWIHSRAPTVQPFGRPTS
jgi:glycosyltransferase involved in cell wall biosynthesis